MHFSETIIVFHFSQDYIFSLLNGYTDPEDIPAGVEVPDGGHYNPYFLSSVIAMAPPLYNGVRIISVILCVTINHDFFV